MQRVFHNRLPRALTHLLVAGAEPPARRVAVATGLAMPEVHDWQHMTTTACTCRANTSLVTICRSIDAASRAVLQACKQSEPAHFSRRLPCGDEAQGPSQHCLQEHGELGGARGQSAAEAPAALTSAAADLSC